MFHFRQCVLLLHAARDPPGVIERVVDGRSDGEVRKGWYANRTEKLFSVLLTTRYGGELHLRVLRACARQRQFLSLRERCRCRCHTAVVIQRLSNELIDGIGMEHGPPISLDLTAEGNVLHGAALRGVLRA